MSLIFEGFWWIGDCQLIVTRFSHIFVAEEFWFKVGNKKNLYVVRNTELDSHYALKVSGHKVSLKFADIISDKPACLVGMFGEDVLYVVTSGAQAHILHLL